MGAVEQPGVHRHAGAVVGNAGLVVFVDEMVVEVIEVLVGQFLAIHILDAIAEHTAVEADEARLGQFADERGDVLLLHVGVGVVFAAGGGVACVAVVDEELHLVLHLTILIVLLAIEDISLGHLVIALGHQGSLHLVLDLLHGDAVVDVETAQDVGHRLL